MVVQLEVAVLVLFVTAEDLQRGDLAIGLQQRVVIALEGVGDILVGGNDRWVVLTPGAKRRLRGASRGRRSGWPSAARGSTVMT